MRASTVGADEQAIAVAGPVTGEPGFSRRWTAGLDLVVGVSVDFLAALLVVVEVCILSAGVFSRYVLDSALVWSDELASILFVWLIMLGAVGAYRRGEHMRLTAFVNRMPPGGRELCSVLGPLAVAVFAIELLVAVIWPSFLPPMTGPGDLLSSIVNGDLFSAGYLGQEMTDFTPALQIPRAFSVLGIVAGLALILILALLRLAECRRRVAVGTIAATIAVGVVAYLARDAFAFLGNYNLLLFFVLFVGAQIVLGIPIAFAFGIATLSYLALATHSPLSVVAGNMEDGMSNLVLLAIPLFVLLGLLVEATGIAKRLVRAIAAFVGHVPGGLNLVLVAAMFLVSGISGSKLADMAALTPVLFPEMERRGQKRGEMIALLSTSGAMAELIPPSLVLIIVGTVCNLSIQALFTGGLLPAALTSVLLISASFLRPKHARGAAGPRQSWRERTTAVVVAVPGLILPLLILYCVVDGVATATEVSTVGVLYSLIVGTLLYRELRWRRLYPMLCEAARLTGAIMLIIATATAMGWALTQSGFATALAAWLSHAPGGAFGFLILSSVIFILLGSVLEGIPAVVLFGPLLFPVARALHVNEIHYAVVMILAMSIGLFAPPLGVGYYGACAVGRCDPEVAAVAIMRYLVALLIALTIIAAVPWLTTALL